jgi:hypothetical protein
MQNSGSRVLNRPEPKEMKASVDFSCRKRGGRDSTDQVAKLTIGSSFFISEFFEAQDMLFLFVSLSN